MRRFLNFLNFPYKFHMPNKPLVFPLMSKRTYYMFCWAMHEFDGVHQMSYRTFWKWLWFEHKFFEFVKLDTVLGYVSCKCHARLMFGTCPLCSTDMTLTLKCLCFVNIEMDTFSWKYAGGVCDLSKLYEFVVTSYHSICLSLSLNIILL